MKKLLLAILFTLVLSGSVHALTIRCQDHAELQFSSLSNLDTKDILIEYGSLDIILDNSGSVHITTYYKTVKYEDIFGDDDTSQYQKKIQSIKNKNDRKKFTDAHRHSMNPLIKDINDSSKNEYFTSISLKADHKIRTNFIYDEDELTILKFVEFYDIDLKSMEVKRYLTLSPESKDIWNSTFTEKDEKAGFKKIGKAELLDHFINCKEISMSINGSEIASSGSGFFINNKGYFITNNHVVDGCTQSKITFKEESIDAELIATDQNLDLALLRAKIKPKGFLNLSNDPPEKLQKIYVAGYPFGKGLSDDLKFTQGIISAVKGYADNSNQIQIDAAINSGNSGGPIVDEDGSLIAVAVSGLDKSASEGIGFGIKASSVRNFLDVNDIDYSTPGILNFGMNANKLNNLLEKSTVYTFCN